MADQLMQIRTDKSIERSIDSLQRIYAAIVALAIGQAIQLTFIDRATGIVSFSRDNVKYLPVFLAFAVTAVPFYHGMNRHLDNSYIERQESQTHGALLFDFVIFFVEASLLFTIASSVKSGLIGFILIGVLLLLDTVWALVSNWIHYKSIAAGVKQWAAINSITIAASVLIYFLKIYGDDGKSWILFVFCLVRSSVDYKFSWDFYFPPSEKKPT